MSFPTDVDSLPEPLPPHLKALLELTRDAQDGFWSREFRYEHLRILFVIICYSFIASHSHDALVPFLGMLVIAFMLHGLSERRARRRLELLLEVLRGIQHSRPADKRT